ncbi:MAG: Bax inhibitor-1/YccA family protein [Phycisphaerales bacterium]|nr:Bax inhibitor-1/YccA family protein [PVC group bacterium]MBL6998205.1 Bax inhibitor-1/YccA family protein [Phycisphaerales bacterium]
MRPRRNMLDSSNPVLKNPDIWDAGLSTDSAETASVQGVVNKTGMLTVICVIGGMIGVWVTQNQPALAWPLGIAGIIATIVVYIMIFRNPMRAKQTAWIYALVQGAFLGVLTNALDGVLESMGYAAMGGLALQAFVITISVLVSMLALYYFRILQPTKKFTAAVSVLTLGIFVTYMISFVMSLFGSEMPFLSLGSAFEGGTSALIGIGLNVLILGVASLWLIIDFGMIEQQVQSGAPKQMEWFCGFILMVTLVWIYLEAVKLCFRLAILFGNRD